MTTDLLKIAEQLNDELKARRKLMSEMVGSLYPRILDAEIAKLQDAINVLKGHDE